MPAFSTLFPDCSIALAAFFVFLEPGELPSRCCKTEANPGEGEIVEFPESVRLAAPKVVVVMTQDWCGQRANMAAYLPASAGEAAIFTVEYNLLPDFERIMRFKEDVFDNRQVVGGKADEHAP